MRAERASWLGVVRVGGRGSERVGESVCVEDVMVGYCERLVRMMRQLDTQFNKQRRAINES